MRQLWLLLLLPGMLIAQTPDDVELFLQNQLYGTPRFTAMGGAFTSLGNDLSAVGINPAAMGVYRHSELGIALSFQPENAQLGPFYGNQGRANNFNLLFDNIGLGLHLNPRNPNLSFGLGITYNKLADFDREWQIQGFDNHYPLAQFWGESSATIFVDDLTDPAFAAWQAYVLVDTVTPAGDAFIRDTASSYAFGTVDGSGNVVSSTDVDYVFDQRGSLGETAITFGGELNKKLYYGIGFGFPTLSFRREEFITEFTQQRDAPPFNATQYTYRRLNDIYANGFNLKVGLIYRPLPQLRIGASYQSPSWYTVTQLFEQDVTARFDAPPFSGVSTRTNSEILSTGEYAYRLRTPSIWRFGISTLIRKSLILSLDYHYSEVRNADLFTNNNSYNISPEILENSFQTAFRDLYRDARSTLAAGLEYRWQKLFIRGGYRYTQSTYLESVEDLTAGAIETYSGGLGYRFGPSVLSLSVIGSRWDRNYVTYTTQDPGTGESVQVLEDVKVGIERINVAVGFRYNF